MKYLKSHNILESINQDIDDVLLHLTDIGFEYSKVDLGKNKVIQITNNFSDLPSFDLDDIRDEMNMLCNLLFKHYDLLNIIIYGLGIEGNKKSFNELPKPGLEVTKNIHLIELEFSNDIWVKKISKKLKGFRLFESYVSNDDIYDILQGCRDIGLLISIFTNKDDTYEDVGDDIYVSITYFPTFNEDDYNDITSDVVLFSDIKDQILHLINYMKSKGYSDYIYNSRAKLRSSVDEFNEENEVNILPDNMDEVSLDRIIFTKNDL